jgi:hypothetical protein
MKHQIHNGIAYSEPCVYHSSIGDFHFTWECFGVSLESLWGSPSFSGSLCHLKEHINRASVDKKAKIFQPADEFFTQVDSQLENNNKNGNPQMFNLSV